MRLSNSTKAFVSTSLEKGRMIKNQFSQTISRGRSHETSTPDVSVLLVCWNNRGYLEPCLHSLYQSGLRRTFEVVVVDNGSTDGGQKMLREQFPEVRIVQNHRNLGLSCATNQGIRATTGRYVLLLNNDTLVNGPSLEEMVHFMEVTPDAGAVGGKLLNPDGSFQGAAARFSSLWQELLIATRLGEFLWEGYPSHEDDKQENVVDWLSSACLLVRRSAFAEVGLLDEEYFIYGDETDFQFRLKRAGWKVYYLPQVTTIHYGGRSMDRWRRRKMVYRGKMLFYRKNYSTLHAFLLRLVLGGLTLAKTLLWSIAWLLPRSRKTAECELRSNIEVLSLCWSLQ
jgi:N-acetylglucosaminyl-diphospho-decaprenol L-rhamnosyltransferase